MPITKTEELRKAFMGGLAAWVIQIMLVLAWIFFGGHPLTKQTKAETLAPIPVSPRTFAATLETLRL